MTWLPAFVIWTAESFRSSHNDRLLVVRQRWASHYDQKSQIPLAGLALAFLAAYAWPILDPTLPDAARRTCSWVGHGIWAVFVADYLLRLVMAERRLHFIRHNWF